MKESIYKPTLRSFICSVGYLSILLLPPATVTYVYYHKSPTFVVTVDVLVGLVFIWQLWSTIIAHRNVVVVSYEGIGVRNMFAARFLEWESVKGALIRERHNKISRTDRLVKIESIDGEVLMFPLSVFSRAAEIEIMERLRRHAPTSTQIDPPSF